MHNESECCLLLPENVAGVGVVLQLRQVQRRVPVPVLQLQVHAKALQVADQLVIALGSEHLVSAEIVTSEDSDLVGGQHDGGPHHAAALLVQVSPGTRQRSQGLQVSIL